MKEIYDVAKLISKEKAGSLTPKEQQRLLQWKMNNEERYLLASNSEQIQKKLDFYRQIDKEKSWHKILTQIPELKTKSIKLKTILKWVATIMLPILATTYLWNGIFKTSDSSTVEGGSPKATLRLSTGTTICLEDYRGNFIQSGKEKLAKILDNELVYEEGKSAEDSLKYNTITTPIRGEYFVQLSDETKVWLNAQTQITFPEKFGKQKREVQLTSGEAYFEVAKDAERTFEVLLKNGSKVSVLGTGFNVMAYHEEDEIQTTLVEGSIKFASGSDEMILKPGQQLGLNNKNGQVRIREVRTNVYTSWREGKFIFYREPMSSVLRKMSRWYGVKIVCTDQDVLQRRISGVTDRYANINELIDLIEEISPIELNLKNNELFVSKRIGNSLQKE